MTTAEMATEKAKKKFKFPTAFTILVIILAVVIMVVLQSAHLWVLRKNSNFQGNHNDRDS